MSARVPTETHAPNQGSRNPTFWYVSVKILEIVVFADDIMKNNVPDWVYMKESVIEEGIDTFESFLMCGLRKLRSGPSWRLCGSVSSIVENCLELHVSWVPHYSSCGRLFQDQQFVHRGVLGNGLEDCKTGMIPGKQYRGLWLKVEEVMHSSPAFGWGTDLPHCNWSEIEMDVFGRNMRKIVICVNSEWCGRRGFTGSPPGLGGISVHF